jgi:NAD(P)-dependent dehydrogenase (short-subunit alcohol dehydrogenase family)
MQGLSGKTALITGGAGALCSRMAEALLEQGVRVALLGRTESRLQMTAKMLNEQGHKNTLILCADVLDKSSLEQARKDLEAHWGCLDILINGAGGNQPGATAAKEELHADQAELQGSFFDLDIDAITQVFDTNFKGTLLASQVFARSMAEQGQGVILNMSSMSAERPLTKVVAYSAAKAAVDNFTKWLAVHMAKRNVRVNALAPGFFVGEQNRFLLYEQDGITLTARGEKILRNTPMGSFGEANDLKGATVFLCSPASRFITGIVLPIDGGFSAYAGV